MCFFRSESDVRYTFVARYTFGVGGPYDAAKSGLADDFSQNNLPITPPEKGHGGRGPKGLPITDFKVGEYSSVPKLFAAKKFRREKK